MSAVVPDLWAYLRIAGAVTFVVVLIGFAANSGRKGGKK